MQSIINIKDQPCGSGKTTSMIEGFRSDRKYLVIVPELTEVGRVINGSKSVPFQQPHANDNDAGTKTQSLENLVLNGINIVATHKLHENLVPLAKDGLLDDYDIIIDEVPDVVKQVAEKSSTSIEEFYVDAGYMLVDQDTGLVTPTPKWWSNKDHVKDTLERKIFGHAVSGCLYLLEGKFFIWAMPRELLTAGRTTTILTYKSEGSMLSAYLRKLTISLEVANDNHQENTFRRKAAELITICDVPALSKLKLSYTGQSKGLKDNRYCQTIVTALKNLRGRQLKGVTPENILITCIKEGWYKDEKEKAAGPFASGSRLFKGAKWIANTTRGTNNHAHCSHLIYLHDQHINPFVARWLGDSSQEFKDAYALTELIQWVWRSRIRRGEPITLYLPSPRMRQLMEEWLSQ
jgi:hypothetical protein